MAVLNRRLKSSNHLKSAEIVASSDIIIEIIIRLPLRKIVQFKLVSKQWFSSITSSGFDRLRDSLQIPKNVRYFASCTDFASILCADFFQIDENKWKLSSQLNALNLSEDPQGTRILHSCSGLLLCSNFRVNEGRWKYYVVNPETNEFSIICEPDDFNEILGVGLAFDPTKSPHYKVVYLMRPESLNVVRIYIYSSETRVWRLSGEYLSERINYEDVVYWNSAIHWIEDRSKNRDDKLLCYDIQDHAFKEMPEKPHFIRDNYYLGKSHNRLNMFWIYEPSQQHLKIYQMRKDYSCWYIMHTIKLSRMFNAYNSMFKPGLDNYPFRVLSIVRGEKEVDGFLVLGTPEKTVRCNIYSQALSMIDDGRGWDALLSPPLE